MSALAYVGGFKVISDNTNLPEGWELKQIKEISKEIRKKNSSKIINVVSVTKHLGIVPSLSYFKNQVYSKDLTGYKVIEKGQFAYATIHLNEGSIGYLNCFEEAVLSPMYIVFEVDNTRVNNYFLFNLLKTKPLIHIYERITPGGVQRRAAIRYSEFSKITIPVPPLPEQQKIAVVLSSVKEATERAENIISALKELKKAMMKHLFTYGPVPIGEAGKVPLKETEIGMIPAHWDTIRFDQFITLQRGQDLPKWELKDGNIPVIGATSVIGYHDSANVKGPGVTVVRSGSSAGKPRFIDSDFWAHNVVLYVKEFNGHDPKFVFYKLTALDLTKYKAGVAVPTLNRNTFSSLQVAVPSSSEQKRIANILSAIDDNIQAEESKKNSLEILFKTLLSLLMTGRIRVNNLEIPL